MVGSRWDYLAKAAEVEGIYVPAFYDVTYKEDGTIDSFVPNHPNAKEKIKKQLVMDMSEAVLPGESGRSIYSCDAGPCCT